MAESSSISAARALSTQVGTSDQTTTGTNVTEGNTITNTTRVTTEAQIIFSKNYVRLVQAFADRSRHTYTDPNRRHLPDVVFVFRSRALMDMFKVSIGWGDVEGRVPLWPLPSLTPRRAPCPQQVREP